MIVVLHSEASLLRMQRICFGLERERLGPTVFSIGGLAPILSCRVQQGIGHTRKAIQNDEPADRKITSNDLMTSWLF